MRVTRRAWFATAAVAPFAWVAGEEVLRPRGHRRRFREDYFPDVVLQTHEGRAVRFYSDLVRDRVVLVNFMYAVCANLCPIVTANLVRVQRLLGDHVGRDVFMYSITLRPEQDTPEVLRRYAEAHGVRPGWWFLTGTRSDIDAIRRALGQVDADPVVDARPARHTGIVRYGNEALARWGACPGEAQPEWIAKAVSWMLPARA